MNYLTANRINGMNRLFNQLYSPKPAAMQRGFKVDIAENRDEYRIYGDLPGFSAENIDVKVEENLLIIEASLPEKNNADGTADSETEKKQTWYLKERKEENLKRSFLLPEDVNIEDIDAQMKNGVLTVVLRKKPEAKPLNIKVKEK